MSAPLIFNGRRAKMLTQDGILRADGSIIDNDGVPNLIKNGHAEINVTGWTVSKNTVAASRPDSGFVTSSTNITWTRNTTNPIDGQADFLYTKDAANRQGEQVYCGFTVAKKHRAKVLQIEVDYLVNSGTFSAGSSSTDSDIIVYIYDVTNSTFIEPSSFKFLSSSSTIADKFVANFQTSATGTSYRILFHQATTSASAFAVQFKDVRVSPCQYVYGTPISDWASYTPAGTWSTNTTWTGFWRRVGQDMEVKFQASLSGAPSGNFTANIPSGYTIDTTKLLSTGTQEEIGFGRINDSGTSVYHFSLRYNSTVSIIGINLGTSGTYLNEPSVVDATTPITFGASDIVNGYFKVPITGWSSSTQVSDGYDGRQIAARYTNTAGTSFTASTEADVPFATKDYDTANSFSTPTFTAPTAGKYVIKAGVRTQSTIYNGQGAALFIRKNGSNIVRLSAFNGFSASSFTYMLNGAETLDLNAGDTIVIRFVSDVNVSLSTTAGDCHLSIEKLQAPQTMSATEVVAASYTVDGGGQSLTSTAVLQFNTKVFDTHNAVTTGSGWKFTAPYQGIYRLSYKMMQANNTGTSCQIAMRKNASAIYRSQPAAIVNGPSTVVSNQMMQADSVLFSLNSGDYIDVYINSAAASGSVYTATTDSWINIERIK